MSSIMTASGNYFDIHDPRPTDVHMDDVAHGLAREQRFTNQTRAPYELGGPLTVGAHSCRVARIGWYLWPEAVKSGLVVVDVDKDTDMARARIEMALAFLLHDSPEAYMRDKPAPHKTDLDREIERGVLKAILAKAVYDDPDTVERLLGWVDSGLGHLADKLAQTQEALLFQRGAADWSMPDHGHGGLAVTRSLVCETLPLFWPGTRENWSAITRMVCGQLHGFDRLSEINTHTRLAEVEREMTFGPAFSWIP